MQEYAPDLPPPLDSRDALSTEWVPPIKHYPHFDKPISEKNIMKLVKDPVKVSQNSFYPFILFYEKVPRFRGRTPKKPRPIRYAARRDAYIYAYYRHLLIQKYEDLLKERNLSDNVIAYRKIPVASGLPIGKCNIHFAKEAFSEIEKYKNCIAIALDISSFFESLDHEKLRLKWEEVLGVSPLPKDHKAVFKAITNYTEVEYNAALEALGYIQVTDIGGVKKKVFTKAKKDIPKQLCSNQEFREKICGESKEHKNLIIKDKSRTKGVPQGSPISDLLANIYMIDFDAAVKKFADKTQSYYRRYSDDILIICPPDINLALEFINFLKQQVELAGKDLNIKDEKSLIKIFSESNGTISCQPFQHDEFPDQSTVPIRNKHFEYLGFSYDGKSIRIKDATLSRYYRKMTLGIRAEIRKHVSRYPNKTLAQLSEELDRSKLYQKYGKLLKFEEIDKKDYEKLTFFTYAKRAAKIMEEHSLSITYQMRNHKKKFNYLVDTELPKQFKKHRAKIKA